MIVNRKEQAKIIFLCNIIIIISFLLFIIYSNGIWFRICSPLFFFWLELTIFLRNINKVIFFRSSHRGNFRRYLFFSSKSTFFWIFQGDWTDVFTNLQSDFPGKYVCCLRRTDTNFFCYVFRYVCSKQIPFLQEQTILTFFWLPNRYISIFNEHFFGLPNRLNR